MKVTVYRKLFEIPSDAPSNASRWSAKRFHCEKVQLEESHSSWMTRRRCSDLPYEVFFDARGGVADYASKTGVVAQKIGELPSATKGDYYFSGWFLENGTRVTKDTLVSVSSRNLHAEYIEPTTVYFDANGGSSSATTIKLYVGIAISGLDQTATGPADKPNFIGWYTQQYGGEKVKNGDVYDGSFTTLFAHYAAQSYTVDLNGQWFLDDGSGIDPNGKAYGTSYSTNPDQSLYDGTYVSYSNFNVNSGWAKMRINFIGYTEFSVHIRSYAESNYDYTVIGNLDQNITSNPTAGYARTYGNQTAGTTISNYTKVTYSNLDGGQHFVDIVFRKDSSVNSNQDRGYVLIEKEQGN